MTRFSIGQTALVVPVPAAEPVVGRLRASHDASAAYGVPAHVSVLFPFLQLTEIGDDVREALAGICSAVPAFDLELACTGRFAGVVWLDPQPDRPFRELTAAVAARWPAYPPYGGAFDEVVPHLTVAEGDDEVLDAAERDVLAGLPIAALAEEVALLGFDGRAWSRRESFPLHQGVSPDPVACCAAPGTHAGGAGIARSGAATAALSRLAIARTGRRSRRPGSGDTP